MHAVLPPGFTLVELLVAFSIAALLIGLVPFAFGPLQQAAQYRQTVRHIDTTLREARQLARTQGRAVAFEINPRTGQFGIEGQVHRQVPEPLQVRAVVAALETDAQGWARIRFSPDGGGTGGSIDILRPSGGGTRVRADWLLGRIEREAL